MNEKKIKNKDEIMSPPLTFYSSSIFPTQDITLFGSLHLRMMSIYLTPLQFFQQIDEFSNKTIGF